MAPGFLNQVFRFRRSRVSASAGLALGVAALETIGLLLIAPVVSRLGFTDGQGRLGVGRVSNWVTKVGVSQISLEWLLLAFLTALSIQAFLRMRLDRINTGIETEFVLQLRLRLYQAVERMGWAQFSELRQSDLVRAFTSEIDHVGQAVQHSLAFSGLMAVAAVQVSLAALVSAKLTAVAVALGGCLVMLFRPLSRRVHQEARSGLEGRAQQSRLLSEHLAGFKLTKVHGMAAEHAGQFAASAGQIARQTIRIRRTFSRSRVASEFSAWALLLGFFYLAVRFLELGTGPLVMMMFIFLRIVPRIGSIQQTWLQAVHHLGAYSRIESLITSLQAFAEANPTTAAGQVELRRAIELQGVSYRYPSKQEVHALDRVSLRLPAGSTLMVMGPSGSGKSTLADLMLGLIAPSHGEVLVDGERLSGPRLAEWRNSVAYVPQECFLFHATIRANLTWLRPEATDDALWTALRDAAAEEFVRRLPDGLDTVVGDRGVLLSGGERQRLTLARALLRRPTLLVLDEATNALDPENQQAIHAALDRLRGRMTLLIIAHQTSALDLADQVAVLERGRVVRWGPPKMSPFVAEIPSLPAQSSNAEESR